MSHSVSLSWTASTDPVSSYNVYRGATATTITTKVNTSPVTTTSYVDTTAVVGSEFYAVTGVLGGVESLLSNSVDAVLLPAAPTNLVLVSAT